MLSVQYRFPTWFVVQKFGPDPEFSAGIQDPSKITCFPTPPAQRRQQAGLGQPAEFPRLCRQVVPDLSAYATNRNRSLVRAKLLDTLDLELQRKIFDHERWIGSNGQRGARAEMDGADLDRVDLREANLSGASLRGANLTQSALSRVKLVMTDLSGANLNDANLIGADLSGANLSYASLIGADLSGCLLGPAEIRDPTTRRPTGRTWAASLVGSDLRRAQLSDSRLYSANLSDANLADADLDGADLTGARLTRVHIPNEKLRRELALTAPPPAAPSRH